MSSWLRSAVNRAVEVGGTSQITRAVRGYADSVVGQAMIGGAKFFQDRGGALNFQDFNLAVKRLEEVSVSCRGMERVQLLRRWLVALKVLEKPKEALQTSGVQDKYDEVNESSSKPTLALYPDLDLGEQATNFRDMFLQSQALEGITLSLILEEPNEEELSLLLEIFRVCLMGDEEVLDVTVTSVRDMAGAFSTYDEEVLARREELLQYAQDAIAALKVNADIERIDSEVLNICQQLEDRKSWFLPSMQKSVNSSGLSSESLKEAIAYVGLFSQLEDLLLRKKSIQKGDPPEVSNAKVDKLKVLIESLATSAIKAEKRVSELRTQKEEALKFRVAKTTEVTQLQKDFVADISALEKRKVELEEELRKVTMALTVANARLRNVREERDQFDEASNQMIQHFKLKDDDLSKSIALYRAEEKVCSTFVTFLERTWFFHAMNTKQKEMLVNNELGRHRNNFVNLAVTLLGAYKEEFQTCISLTLQLVDKLKENDEGTAAVHQRKIAMEQYLHTETKVETIMSSVYSIKKQIHKQNRELREDEPKLMETLHDIEKMKADFESMEKPAQQETATKPRTPRIPFLLKQTSSTREQKLDADFGAQRGIALPFNPIINLPLPRILSSGVPKETTITERDQMEEEEEGVGPINNEKFSNAEAQLSKLKLELEQESHSRGSSMDGIFDWEFDEKVDKTTSKSS